MAHYTSFQKDTIFLYMKAVELIAQISIRSDQEMDAVIALLNAELPIADELDKFALSGIAQIIANFKEKR